MPRNCKECSKEIPSGRRQGTLYCGARCSRAQYRRNHLSRNKRKDYVSKVSLGALAELAVCADLVDKGYDVFRSVSPSATCDLVVIKESEPIRVEVTTGWVNTTGTRYRATKKDQHRHRFDLLAVYYADNKSIVYEPELT